VAVHRVRRIAVAVLLVGAVAVLASAALVDPVRAEYLAELLHVPEAWIAIGTIGLAIATFWLAWQTRALTVNAKEELDLLREQTRAGTRQSEAAAEQLRLVGLQIEASKNLDAYKLLRTEDDRFRDDEFIKKRANLARTLLLDPTDFKQVGAEADYVLDYFEDLGILVGRDIVPDFFVWATSAYYVLRYWEATKGYLQWVRARDGDDTLFEDFEELYRRVRAYEEGRRKEAFSISDAELTGFLMEEIEETDPVVVRSFRSSDLRRVLEIEASAFEEADAYERPQFDELYRDHSDGFLVAELLEQKVIGYVVGYVSNDLADIDSIAVDPRFHRIGCGRKLLSALIERLTASGAVVSASLETRVSNQRAQDFFKSLGFEVTETVADFYGDGRHAYRMTKSVARGDHAE
jgi:[ribosomal protein S18]-alanine N-acetyltransferase